MEINKTIVEQQGSIKLIKGARSMGWEIKQYGDDLDILLKKIEETHKKLISQFPL